jgi:hypothetical protein
MLIGFERDCLPLLHQAFQFVELNAAAAKVLYAE